MPDFQAAVAYAHGLYNVGGGLGNLARAFLSFYESPSPLTARQTDVLRFIASYIERRAFAPSFSEIASHIGCRSLSTVYEHLTNLERKGWIVRNYRDARSIRVIHRLPEIDPADAAKFACVDPSISIGIAE